MVSERGLKLIVFLKEFDIEIVLRKTAISDLKSRHTLERIVYFLQEFGAKIGYTFGWYIFGPYSTQLVGEVHEISFGKELSKSKIPKLNLQDKKALKKCKEFMKDLIGENKEKEERWLQLACIIHFLNKYYHKHLEDVESFETILSKFESKKFQRKEIESAWDLLKKHGLISSS